MSARAARRAEESRGGAEREIRRERAQRRARDDSARRPAARGELRRGGRPGARGRSRRGAGGRAPGPSGPQHALARGDGGGGARRPAGDAGAPRMAGRQQPRRLRVRHPGRHPHAALPRLAGGGAAGAGRPHADARPALRGSAPAQRPHRPVGRRSARRGGDRGRGRRPPARVPPGGRAADLALRGGRLRRREARLPRAPAEHRLRPLPAAPGSGGRPPGDPPHRAFPAARRPGVDAARHAVRADRDRRPLPARLVLAGAAAAALVAGRGGADLHRRRPPDLGGALRGGGEARLRVDRRSLVPRLLRRRPVAGQSGQSGEWGRGWRGGRGRGGQPPGVDRVLGDPARPAAARSAGGGDRAAGAAAGAGRPSRPGRDAGGADPGRRPVRDRSRAQRGRRARPRRRRRSAQHRRRLPLVHRLGAGHHDRARGADAGHRAPHRGRLHPAHLRPLRPRRADPQPLPRGRQGGPLQHRGRLALVLPRPRPLPGRDRRP